MPAIILDACGTINLYASGRFTSTLAALGVGWYLPAAVVRESPLYRRPDPADPEKLVSLPMDLGPAIGGGVLRRCDCEGDEEAALYVELAARIGDDGESLGLAIARCRGWSVLTDDKKARGIAKELGVPVLGTPEVPRGWAVATGPGEAELAEVLAAIRRFSNCPPGRNAADHDRWAASLRPADPG